MKTTYLEYYKQLLAKVSFDPQLFQKEYVKASRILEESEKQELNEWLQARGLSYHMVGLQQNEPSVPVQEFQYYRLWSSM